MDPKQRAEFDQNMALMLDFVPTAWWQLYVRLIAEGFTESQAMDLVKTYVTATSKG